MTVPSTVGNTATETRTATTQTFTPDSTTYQVGDLMVVSVFGQESASGLSHTIDDLPAGWEPIGTQTTAQAVDSPTYFKLHQRHWSKILEAGDLDVSVTVTVGAAFGDWSATQCTWILYTDAWRSDGTLRFSGTPTIGSGDGTAAVGPVAVETPTIVTDGSDNMIVSFIGAMGSGIDGREAVDDHGFDLGGTNGSGFGVNIGEGTKAQTTAGSTAPMVEWALTGTIDGWVGLTYAVTSSPLGSPGGWQLNRIGF